MTKYEFLTKVNGGNRDTNRFMRHITLDDDCWIWRGAKDKDGYGFFKIGSRTDGSRKQVRAHRWIWEWFNGEIPTPHLDHLCRNPSCVNPDHLEPVTPQENTKRGCRANKTHCKSGHELSGDNLIVYPPSKTHPNGMRRCRECANRWAREWRERQKKGNAGA